ncbi:flavodoxin family protein [Saccharopolyspora gloriosae]|uniref:Flavodoxin n=1 Tax=Saccharopolyspora gloriosae TaxID=455344 RepID=A0A840NGQ3_9PSEU|nr:flavodoxin family protein [Saccharopolyspora gloriosae]MBB5070201.1 flavodoxin [Saccharopolyspora gloriosae]
MRTVIVCVSVSHGNTRRVADEMARVLDARVVAPEQADPAELAAADLVGFGSGVFRGKMHPRLTGFVEELPGRRGSAFVFATSGFPEMPLLPFSRPLTRLLEGKGFAVDGTFSCRAFDTWAPFKPIGGLRKRRPNDADLAAARAFAAKVRAGRA